MSPMSSIVLASAISILPWVGDVLVAGGDRVKSPDSKAAATAGEPNEAEKLFRALEQRIVKAKTLQFSFEHEYKVAGVGTMSCKGKATLADGGKALLEGEHGGLASGSTKFVSDGKKIRSTLSVMGKEKGSTADMPKSLQDTLTKSFSRCGCYVIMSFMDELESDKGLDLNVDKLLLVSDFKLGPREKIGTADAQLIDYRLDFKGHEKFAAKVWIDLATGLPVKHYLQVGAKDDGLRVTTTYSGLSVDQKVDEKMFALPK